MTKHNNFGSRRIYYNNFASHLLNAYNPNMLYPELPNRWSDEDWRRCIDMIASFGFNAFEFWLVPRLFCREGIKSELGQEFIRQMNMLIDYAHTRNVEVMALISLATVGTDWHTFCPNVKEEWNEVRNLWDAWTKALLGLDIVSIFPGDPGACSRNGCTAETYIDKSIEIAHLIKRNIPDAEIEFGTWGPPFFGWGLLEGSKGWKGEFVQEDQHTAWRFDKERTERCMNHLLKRLPDFPNPTSIAINLGFNPDGTPDGDQSTIYWANEIAKTHRINSWDFSLTEGENAIIPHFRFERLFEQRKRERLAAPYNGGISYTMTPLLNQLSLYESAQSFLNPDGDYIEIAETFCEKLFGCAGKELVPYLELFEVIPDWGNHVIVDMPKEEYHQKMIELVDLLQSLTPVHRDDFPIHPSPEVWLHEHLFFAKLFRDLSGLSPDFDSLHEQYWNHVYAIYDKLPTHVDPRPKNATNTIINYFRGLTDKPGFIPGKWSK